MTRAILSLILALFANSGTVFGQNAVQVARKAFPSTVLIICNDSNGQQISLGSGFVIPPGVVATNHHVVEGAASATVKMIGEQQTHKVTHIRNIDARNDLALLSVASMKAPAVAIGDSNSLEVGATVYVVGNPRGLEGSFSEGIVSAIRPLGEVSLLQITAETQRQQSQPMVGSKSVSDEVAKSLWAQEIKTMRDHICSPDYRRPVSKATK